MFKLLMRGASAVGGMLMEGTGLGATDIVGNKEGKGVCVGAGVGGSEGTGVGGGEGVGVGAAEGISEG